MAHKQSDRTHRASQPSSHLYQSTYGHNPIRIFSSYLENDEVFADLFVLIIIIHMLSIIVGRY